MCEYFVKADPILFESRSRTVRIHGALTSIRLENMMWDVLAEMAAAEHLTTSGLISRFHNEIMASGIEALNFASFLRVTCVRYMRKQLDEVKSERKPALPAASNLVSLQARN
jgi:predicted DNA-binding ribbon-helix-helix protein